jgi:hypothetical protein
VSGITVKELRERDGGRWGGKPRVKRAELFTKNGFPVQGLRNALDVYECKTLEELQAKIANPDEFIGPNSFMRVRGCGQPGNPGKVTLFLFPHLLSRAEQIEEKTLLNLGDGI